MTEARAAQAGWRLGTGVGLIVAGYAALALIPVVTSLPITATAATFVSSGMSANRPVSAVLMPSFRSELGTTLFGGLLPDQVGRARYRFGLALFMPSIVVNSEVQ